MFFTKSHIHFFLVLTLICTQFTHANTEKASTANETTQEYCVYYSKPISGFYAVTGWIFGLGCLAISYFGGPGATTADRIMCGIGGTLMTTAGAVATKQLLDSSPQISINNIGIGIGKTFVEWDSVSAVKSLTQHTQYYNIHTLVVALENGQNLHINDSDLDTSIEKILEYMSEFRKLEYQASTSSFKVVPKNSISLEVIQELNTLPYTTDLSKIDAVLANV